MTVSFEKELISIGYATRENEFDLRGLNILRIENIEEFYRFTDRYKRTKGIVEYIDWNTVKSKYDGTSTKYSHVSRHRHITCGLMLYGA
jgi:hypothetical protein